jgi:hypothetical protein
MALATQMTGRTRSKLSAIPGVAFPSRVDILENPLASHNPVLAAEVEQEVLRALRDEDLGSVQVRFRECQDDADGLRFICKVENPPRVDGDGAAPSWRWWSPLLESPQQFRDSLEEGLKVRRLRLEAIARGR